MNEMSITPSALVSDINGGLGPLEDALRAAERPASAAEQRMWWTWRAGTAGRAHHTSFGLDIRGSMDAELLRKALRLMMARHEGLRARFTETGQGLIVRHSPLTELATPLRIVDIGTGASDRDFGRSDDIDCEKIKATLVDAFARPLALEKGPTWEAILMRGGPARCYLHVSMHHAISDATSFGIFFRDLYASYSALLMGREPAWNSPGRSVTPALPDSDRAAALAYWLKTLRDAPAPVSLRPDPDYADGNLTGSDRNGAVLVRPLDAAWRRRFETAAAAATVTTYEAMLACLAAALQRFTGQNDIVIGSMTAGRRFPDDELAIGCFASPIAWRVAVNSSLSLAEHVARVADRVRQGLVHAHLPFQSIVERLAPLRDADVQPLFSTLFILQSTLGAVDGRFGDAEATLTFEDEARAASEYDLFLQITPRDGFDLRATYRSAKYHPDTIADLLDALVLIMSAFASGHAGSTGEIDILSPATRATLVSDLNATVQPRAAAETLIDLFELAAARGPATVAIYARDRTRTYGEVGQNMRKHAARLVALGVVAGDRICVLMDRDVHLAGIMLAILRIGAIYVPLEPQHPRAYLSRLVEDTKPAAFICDHAHESTVRGLASDTTILVIDEADGPVDDDTADAALAGVARPTQDLPAYIIFTSGSTGVPKGVSVGHASLHNLVCWASETFTLAELRGVLCASSIAFDSSIFELFAPLGNGGGIVLVENLLELADRHAALPVTLLVTGAPSAFLEIARAGGVPPTTKAVILAGEAVPRALVDELYSLPFVERVFNIYGPTEATVYATAFQVPRSGSGPPSIGTPIANTTAYVLDGRGDLAPFGALGELVIGGRQLALGYFGRSDLTQERFVPDPFVSGARIYRTGDLAIRTRNGRLWFHGRNDSQIKLRGVRIEVEEIEGKLLLHDGVRIAAVKLHAPPNTDPVLVAYVVPRDPVRPPDADALRAHMAALLPRLKLPGAYEIRPSLPLNANGKLDRAKLELPPVHSVGAGSVATSRTETIVAEVWREVLGHREFTSHDRFFDRGGHSMLLLRLQARLRARFGHAPEIIAFFELSSVRDIAAWYDATLPVEPSGPASGKLPGRVQESKHRGGSDGAREVAIVGFSCRLPGADDPNALWTALATGADVVRMPPSERWSPSDHATVEEPDGGAMRWLAMLDDIAGFDPEAFGMTKREADLADPQLRLLLELGATAISGSGRSPFGGLPRKTGVYVGASFMDYAAILARAGIADGQKSTGNAFSMLANRMSRTFGLAGPSLCLDTACSSGLVALDMAWRAITAGEVDAAVVGGVALIIAPDNIADWRAAGMLSRRGRSRSFGADADGYGVGEGGVVLVLKPLKAARDAGDPIHGVICGTAVSHDGGESIGVAAPSAHAQAVVIRAALDAAGLRPDDIDAIEAHGTGTLLGDPIEWRALADVFATRAQTLPPCQVSAAKSVFGHLGPPAGLVGVAAVLMALRQGTIAPVRGFGAPNPHLVETSALAIADVPRPWQTGTRRRISGVSAMGFGGVNAHAIIAEAEPPTDVAPAAGDGAFLLVLSALNARRLIALARALLPAVEDADVSGVRDLCATSAWQGHTLPVRCAIVARDAEQLRDRLALLASADPDSDLAALRRRFILIGPASAAGGGSPTTGLSDAYSKAAEAAGIQFVDHKVIDWTTLFPPGGFRRVALPMPFRRIRCWALDGVTPHPPVAVPGHRAPQEASAPHIDITSDHAELLQPIWAPTSHSSRPASLPSASRDVTDGDPAEPIIIAGADRPAADLLRRLVALGRPAIRAEGASTPCAPLIVVEPNHPMVLAEAVRRFAPRRCILVTRMAQAVAGTERILNPLQAASWGLLEVLTREYPQLTVRAIDADDATNPEFVIAEILGEDASAAVGLRMGQRFAPAARALPSRNLGAVLDPRGRYLVTGGTGGIAARLIEWLLERYDAQVFVLSRRPPARGGPVGRAAGAWFGDITAPGEALRLSAEIRRTIGGIDGVFHLAGRFVRARISEATREDFDAALSAKLDVAVALDEALAHFDPKFVAAFGSWAAYRAPAGYGPYAAANRALGAFTAARRAAGRPFTTIVWPGWQATGMGADILDAGAVLDPTIALTRIEPALAAAAGEVLVTVSQSSSRSLPQRVGVEAVKHAESGASNWRHLVEARIAEHLGSDLASLRGDTSFVDLGLDSIGARSLARDVAAAAGVKLSPTVFFNYGTLRQLLARCAELRESGVAPDAEALPAIQLPRIEPAATPTVPIDDRDVAIIGMACRFPGSEDLATFWDALVAGRDCVGPVPLQRRDAYMSVPIFERCAGGFLSRVDGFDGTPFGILPAEARALDPQQTILLETALQALEDAGVADSIRGTRAGVFIGASATPFPDPDGVPITAHSLIGRGIALMANRISYVFDLTGPSHAVDTLCSSALVALHQAVRSLRADECDMAIVAGVRVGVSALYYEGALAMQAVSPSGRCRPFGEGADGMVPGEGCGVLVLERQDVAHRAGRRIRALVAGTAVAHHGHAAGLATPVAAGQARVIRSALKDARVDASQVDYIEAHGTGTALGDPIEFEGLAQVFSADRPRLLGSVKSNIGHLEPAAAIAGVIKVALALENRRVPASLHADQPNPLIDFEAAGFAVPQTCVDWPSRSEAATAGVSAFGLGGTLAHAVLRAAPRETANCRDEPRAEALIVPVQAYSPAALARTAGRYAAAFGRVGTVAEDLCHSIAVGRMQKPLRSVAVGVNAADLAEQLHALARGARKDAIIRTSASIPRVAFSFSGQGGYRVGIGADLYRTHPAFRAAYDRCRACFDKVGISVPVPTEVGDDANPDWTAPLAAQPALMAFQIALAALYQEVGVPLSAVTGHSLGEIAAAVTAGALDLDAGVAIVAARGREMQKMPVGAMLAIRAEPTVVEAMLAPLEGGPEIAAFNAPDEVVISGACEPIAQAADLAEQAGLGHILVPVDRAFHSRATEPILSDFQRAIAGVTPSAKACVTFVSGLTGRAHSGAELTSVYWSRHVREPVRFAAAAATVIEHADVVIDIGPDGATARLGPRSTRQSEARWLGRGGAAESLPLAFARIVGQLFLAGVPIRWSAVYPAARRIEAPPYAFDVVNRPVAARPPVVRPNAPLTASPPSANVGDGDAIDVVRDLVAKSIGLPADAIAPDATLIGLGADSLILATLTHRLKERFGADVRTRRFFTDLKTVASIAAHVTNLPQPAAAPSPAKGLQAPAPARMAEREPLPAAASPAEGLQAPAPARMAELEPLPPAFVAAYRERTARSFERAVEARSVLADRRVSASFTTALKETQYPIVSRRAAGGRFEDIDGNTYVDIAMGFGVQLFGHAHRPIVEAAQAALERGLHLGPQAELAADVARRVTALTETERVAFCNSGTEAIMLAVRLARAATNRDLLVIFDRSYHGFWDGTLFQADGGRTQPLSIGIVSQAGQSVRVLPFGEAAALDSLMPEADRIAAVLVEPVPSRHPGLRPGDFLCGLRAFCDRVGAALIFDEVLGGFRFHPAGSAGYFGVKPDLATYGKILGGGLPIGAVAGRATFLDGVDGGFWSYGDASFPAGDQVFFASTFAKNPLTMAAASAVLGELQHAGPSLQADLARRTDALVPRLGAAIDAAGVPIRVANFTSLFGFDAPPRYAGFFRHLVHRGVYVWEGRTCFLSTAHTDDDLEHLVTTVGEAARAVADA